MGVALLEQMKSNEICRKNRYLAIFWRNDWATYFRSKIYALISTEKRVGLHFGRFVHQCIWPPWSQPWLYIHICTWLYVCIQCERWRKKLWRQFTSIPCCTFFWNIFGFGLSEHFRSGVDVMIKKKKHFRLTNLRKKLAIMSTTIPLFCAK
jgi:hypothetical protein